MRTCHAAYFYDTAMPRRVRHLAFSVIRHLLLSSAAMPPPHTKTFSQRQQSDFSHEEIISRLSLGFHIEYLRAFHLTCCQVVEETLFWRFPIIYF